MRVLLTACALIVTACAAFAQTNGRASITQDTLTGNVLTTDSSNQPVKPSNFAPGQLLINGVVPTTGPQYQAVTVSAAGNTASNIAGDLHVAYLTANAGSGSYTATWSIADAGRIAGDFETMHLHFAASTNPTIEIHDNTSGGTLLFTWTGDGTVTDILAEFHFNGSAWYLHDAHFIW